MIVSERFNYFRNWDKLLIPFPSLPSAIILFPYFPIVLIVYIVFIFISLTIYLSESGGAVFISIQSLIAYSSNLKKLTNFMAKIGCMATFELS